MNRMEAKLTASFVAITLSSCMSSGTQIKDSQLSAFQVGVTTESDVIRALGPPESETVSSSGVRSMIYTSTRSAMKLATFIPYIGIFAGGSKGQTSLVTISFDRGGRMTEVTTSRTDINVDSGFMTANVSMRAVPTTVPVQGAPESVSNPATRTPAAIPSSSPHDQMLQAAPAARSQSGGCSSLGVDMKDLMITAMGGIDGVTGAMVTRVLPNGAAAGAGIRQGDIVLRVGDAPINAPDDVHEAVCRLPSGAIVDVKLSRQAQPIWVSVRF